MSNQKVPMPTTNVVQPKPVMLPPTATPVALTFCGASLLRTVQYDGSAVLAHEETTGIAYHQASSRTRKQSHLPGLLVLLGSWTLCL